MALQRLRSTEDKQMVDIVANLMASTTAAHLLHLKVTGTGSYSQHKALGDYYESVPGVADSIALYSFALRPEEHQPSGTCNFSRIDTAQLNFAGGSGETISALTIYAVNYNVLRIMSGMGGLAYSN